MSKAEAIRKVLNERGPEVRNKDVVIALAEQGMEVSPQQIANEKQRIKAAAVDWTKIPMGVVQKATELIKDCGSVEMAIAAINAAEHIVFLKGFEDANAI